MCVKIVHSWDRAISKMDIGLYHWRKCIQINLVPVTVSQLNQFY